MFYKNFVHVVDILTMATDEKKLKAALKRVEEERSKKTNTPRMKQEDICAMGAVKYVINLPDLMRRDAHAATMIKRKETEKDETLCAAYTIFWLQFFKVQEYLDQVDLHIIKIQDLGKFVVSTGSGIKEKICCPL